MESKHWLIEGINEWKQLFGGYNWYTMTLIHIYFEKENMAHGYEFQVILLGLGFRIHYNTDRSLELFDEWANEDRDEWQKELAEDLKEQESK